MRRFLALLVCGAVVSLCLASVIKAQDFDVSVAGVTTTSIGIRWDLYEHSNFDHYRVDWKPSGTSSWSWNSDPLTNQYGPTYVITGLDPETMYDIRVCYEDESGYKNYSNSISAMTTEIIDTQQECSNSQIDAIKFNLIMLLVLCSCVVSLFFGATTLYLTLVLYSKRPKP